MVSRIIVPKEILEQIRYDGMDATKELKETGGHLFGLYDKETDSILTSKQYNGYKRKGDPSLKGFLYDVFKHSIGLPKNIYVALKFCHHVLRSKKNGKNPAIVFYHSHYLGDCWSDVDLRAAKFWHTVLYPFAKTADLLCVAETHKRNYPLEEVFEAIDGNGNSIPVLTEDLNLKSLE